MKAFWDTASHSITCYQHDISHNAPQHALHGMSQEGAAGGILDASLDLTGIEDVKKVRISQFGDVTVKRVGSSASISCPHPAT